MTFVIRSMSTTDYRPAYRGAGGKVYGPYLPEPYHCYLLPVAKRISAYWAPLYAAMQFDTAEQAQAEIERCSLTSCDVVPADHEKQGLPAYWEKHA